jgi:SpoVK/Ycf46/Vps4 family AAA+-type ATPase
VGRTRTSERERSETPKKNPRSTTAPDAFTYSLPKERFSDLGGIQELIADIRELIERPLLHPEIYQHLGVRPPSGVLLHGPTGCGKTLLAHAIGGVNNQTNPNNYFFFFGILILCFFFFRNWVYRFIKLQALRLLGE